MSNIERNDPTMGSATTIQDDLPSQSKAQKISEYEIQFGMTSEEFIKRWEEGTAPDTFETNHWANLLRRSHLG